MRSAAGGIGASRCHGKMSGRDPTAIPGAEINGVHLRLPGFGEGGPTLEIFQYNQEASGPRPAINRPGLAHFAFRR